MGPRVVVALSGGVDSSVSAYLLKQAGYEVIGVSMRLATQEDPEALPAQRRCCGVEDVDDARRVCQVLGVPHYNLNFEKQFKAQVVDYFIREYQRGRTPHPCIACNAKSNSTFCSNGPWPGTPSSVVNQQKWDRSGPEKIIVMKS